jgi:lipoprotein NlpD
VKKGETLYSIAWRANSDVRQIAKLNKIYSPYKIYPGQKIFLVAKKSTKSTKASAGKTLHKKPTKSSSAVSTKSTQKTLASTKKQAYGKNVSADKTVQKSLPKSTFSKKIKRWQWPVNGKIIEHFSNRLQGNKGINIAGRRGTKIRAAASGKVVYAGNALRGYGKLVIIKHNDDYLSAYAHNDKILVKEEQLIKLGDVIAKMGNTGASNVMLHFEVRFRGKSVDPLKYLPKR